MRKAAAEKTTCQGGRGRRVILALLQGKPGYMGKWNSFFCSWDAKGAARGSERNACWKVRQRERESVGGRW